MRQASFLIALTLAASLVPHRDAAAAWQRNGIPLAPAGSSLPPRIGADGAGGIFAAWNPQAASSQVNDLRVLRRLADGSLAPGWADTGVKIATFGDGTGTIPNQIGWAAAIMPDGVGGAFVHYQIHYSTATGAALVHMGVTGPVAAGWPVELVSSQGATPSISLEDDGGVLYALKTYSRFGMPTSVILGRLRANGSTAAKVTALTSTDPPIPSIATDHSGGAYVGWPCVYNGLDSTLTYSAWGPVAVPSCGSNVIVSSDGEHGFYLAWLAGSTIRVTRFDASGDVVPGWAPSGLAAGTGYAHSTIGLLDDGTGGLFVTWPAANDLRVQRLTSAGAIVPGWAAAGTVIGPAPNVSAPSEFVADGTGGLYVGWVAYANGGTGTGIFAQHLTASGVPATGWLPTGDPICYPGGGGVVSATTDGAGGVYFGWLDARDGNYRLYGQHLFAGDLIPLAAPVPRAGTMSLAALANPSSSALRFSLVLPEAGDALIEVFDLAGRRVAQRSLLAAAAGAHEESLKLAGASPCVYLVRLTQSMRTVSARVIVTR